MKIEELRKRRTDIDFKDYIITETKTDDIYIIRFAKPNTGCGSVVFINTNHIMAVTGDWGNWIFCREFHPSPNGYVSDSYWCEKLRIASTQKVSDHDADGTRKEIKERLIGDDLDVEDKNYLESLLDYVDECEERYLVYAHDNLPRNRDFEFVPHVKKLNPWLEVIFDAFDEICRRKSPNAD